MLIIKNLTNGGKDTKKAKNTIDSSLT